MSYSCEFEKSQTIQTQVAKNIFIQGKFILWLTFNPGLLLTLFHTTWPKMLHQKVAMFNFIIIIYSYR